MRPGAEHLTKGSKRLPTELPPEHRRQSISMVVVLSIVLASQMVLDSLQPRMRKLLHWARRNAYQTAVHLQEVQADRLLDFHLILLPCKIYGRG